MSVPIRVLVLLAMVWFGVAVNESQREDCAGVHPYLPPLTLPEGTSDARPRFSGRNRRCGI
jgi:hypothetical protein